MKLSVNVSTSNPVIGSGGSGSGTQYITSNLFDNIVDEFGNNLIWAS